MPDETPVVLIVDDNQQVADLYTKWLSDTYTVKTAYSGVKARDILDERIDVVLLDRRMPRVRGEEVLATIQERDLSCRVALVTTVEPNFDILEMGFDAYVEKGVTQTDLHNLVETLLSRMQYDEQLQEYFALRSKQAALEAHKDPAELESHSEFTKLKARVSELEQELQTVLTEFTDDDFRAAFRRLS